MALESWKADGPPELDLDLQHNFAHLLAISNCGLNRNENNTAVDAKLAPSENRHQREDPSTLSSSPQVFVSMI